MDKSSAFPLEKELKTGGKPVELCFSLYSHFGTHDSDTSGERLREIESSDGKVLSLESNSNEWQEIAPGIELKYTLEYGASSRDSSYRVRIQPTACPVVLRSERVHEYSASDYPHDGSSSERKYSIRVVNG